MVDPTHIGLSTGSKESVRSRIRLPNSCVQLYETFAHISLIHFIFSATGLSLVFASQWLNSLSFIRRITLFTVTTQIHKNEISMNRPSLLMIPILPIMFLLSSVAYPIVGQQDKWGALAISYQTKRYGWAIDRISEAQAVQDAVIACGVEDCKSVLQFKNSCGAYAKGDGGWGWAIGGNKEIAMRNAMNNCQKMAKGCQIVNWACTSR
jgi:hypothetical protein